MPCIYVYILLPFHFLECVSVLLNRMTVSKAENATAHSSANKISDVDPELMPVSQAETAEEGVYKQ